MEQFEVLKKFFQNDMKIKEIILNLAPTELDDYNEKYRIEYTDKLNKVVKELEPIFVDTAKEFKFGQEVENAIKAHFARDKRGTFDFTL